MNLLGSPSGRYTLFTLLYFCEGAPIGFIWYAVPTLLKSRDVPTDRVGGLIALLVLPWALKFLWAPLVDSWRGSRFGFKGWIAGAQTVMGLSLFPLILLDPVRHLAWWSALLWLHAIAAATQDVAVDALAIRSTPAHQHGRINSCMQTGMLLGRGLFGGGSIWLASWAGLETVMIVLIGCIWLGMGSLRWVAEPPPDAARSARTGFHQFAAHMKDALRHRRTWWALLFALSSAAAFETVGVLAGPLLVDRQADADTISLFFALIPTVTPLVGVVLGGMLSDRLGRRPTVALFLLGFVLMIVGLVVADRLAATPVVLMSWLAGMFFFIGMFTAASYALYMDLTDPKLGGTQYSMFMSATNGCESWSAKAGGHWAHQHGYPTAFLLMCGVSLLSLPLLLLLGRRRAGDK